MPHGRAGRAFLLAAAIAGDFCIFILFLPIVELTQGAARRGTTAVAFAAVIFLLLLWRRVRRRDAGCPPAPPPSFSEAGTNPAERR
jgi:Na+/melibiose symporter-like transporter